MATKGRTDGYFRKRFKIERERRKWSQADVADLLKGKDVHVPVTAIAKIEAGTRTVRIDEATAIADLFEVSLDSLLGRRAGLEDDLAYALRALRDTARGTAEQLAVLKSALLDRADDLNVLEFEGREPVQRRISEAAKNLVLAQFALWQLERFAVPPGTAVAARRDDSDEKLDQLLREVAERYGDDTGS